MQLSSPQSSVPWSLSALVSLDFLLHLLTQGTPCSKPGNSRQKARLLRGLTVYFLSLSDHSVLYCLMSSVLKIVVSYILSRFLVVLGRECVSSPWCSILGRSRSLTSSFLNTIYCSFNLLITLTMIFFLTLLEPLVHGALYFLLIH